MQRTAPHAQRSTKRREKSRSRKSLRQPAAFRNQLEQCCIFLQVRKYRRRPGGNAVRCVELRRVTEALGNDGNHT